MPHKVSHGPTVAHRYMWVIQFLSCLISLCRCTKICFPVPDGVCQLFCVWCYDLERVLFASPWTATHQAPLSFTISQSLLKFISIELVTLSNHFILCHPLLLLSSIFPSIRVFSNESALCIRGPKYWGFSISPSNEYSGLISFRTDWFHLLAGQGTLQESSPTPQFESINSLTLSLLYGQTLTSIHYY